MFFLFSYLFAFSLFSFSFYYYMYIIIIFNFALFSGSLPYMYKLQESVFILQTLSDPKINVYTCQLSRIMHESHTCGLKTLISRINHNSSHLSHKSERIVSLHMINNIKAIAFPQKYSKKVLNDDFVS